MAIGVPSRCDQVPLIMPLCYGVAKITVSDFHQRQDFFKKTEVANEVAEENEKGEAA